MNLHGKRLFYVLPAAFSMYIIKHIHICESSVFATFSRKSMYDYVRLITKGCYFLVIENDSPQDIQVGALGGIFFPAGFYVYTGSAMGGLDQRIARHKRRGKKLRWHIDYLLANTRLVDVHKIVTGRNIECILADALARRFESVPGFGCSDCRCKSHVFYHSDKKEIETAISQIIVSFHDMPE